MREMKRILKILFFLFVSIDVYGFTILIDPGHGGEDYGAQGKVYGRTKGKRFLLKKVVEKNLTLIYASKIRERLLAKKYRVYLSRSFDHTITLEKRAEISQTVKADIFISIHMNSSLTSTSNGFEIYYLDNHNDGAVKKVEEVENVGLKGEDLIIHQILTDLVVDRTVKGSMKLANQVYENVEKSVFKRFSVKGRGIRPGLFYVLALSKRPGILLELGFLSNGSELTKLTSSKFQDVMVNSIVEGIDSYFHGAKSAGIIQKKAE